MTEQKTKSLEIDSSTQWNSVFDKMTSQICGEKKSTI